MRQRNRGITLVELLTVITILAVLMAILFPAYGRAIAAARLSWCINNQKQLSLAIIEYESKHSRLPGDFDQFTAFDSAVLQTTGGTVQFNWAEAIMPFIEHNDIYQKIENATATANTPVVTVEILVCPADSYLKANPTQAPLSYVVNSQYFYNFQTQSGYLAPPYDFNKKAQQKVILSKMASPVNTVMLTENTLPPATAQLPATLWNNANPWNANIHPGPWNALSSAVPPAHVNGFSTATPPDYVYLTFNGITGPVTAPPSPLPAAPPPISQVVSSPHGSTIVLSFFDGHQQQYSTDAPFPLP